MSALIDPDVGERRSDGRIVHMQEFVVAGHDQIIRGKERYFGDRSCFSATVPEWRLGTRFEQGPRDEMESRRSGACVREGNQKQY
jgi:hypothetical protein